MAIALLQVLGVLVECFRAVVEILAFRNSIGLTCFVVPSLLG